MFPTALLARRLGLTSSDPPISGDHLRSLPPSVWGLPDLIVEPAVIRRVAELVAADLRDILTTPAGPTLDGPDEMLDVAGVAALLNTTERAVYRWRRARTGPPCIKLAAVFASARAKSSPGWPREARTPRPLCRHPGPAPPTSTASMNGAEHDDGYRPNSALGPWGADSSCLPTN